MTNDQSCAVFLLPAACVKCRRSSVALKVRRARISSSAGTGSLSHLGDARIDGQENVWERGSKTTRLPGNNNHSDALMQALYRCRKQESEIFLAERHHRGL